MGAEPKGYQHPKTIAEFEAIYREEYRAELAYCDKWTELCKAEKDFYGVNFHQGMRAAHCFNNIKMEQLLRVLKGQPPNV